MRPTRHTEGSTGTGAHGSASHVTTQPHHPLQRRSSSKSRRPRKHGSDIMPRTTEKKDSSMPWESVSNSSRRTGRPLHPGHSVPLTPPQDRVVAFRSRHSQSFTSFHALKDASFERQAAGSSFRPRAASRGMPSRSCSPAMPDVPGDNHFFTISRTAAEYLSQNSLLSTHLTPTKPKAGSSVRSASLFMAWPSRNSITSSASNDSCFRAPSSEVLSVRWKSFGDENTFPNESPLSLLMHDIKELPGFCSVAGLVSSPCSGSLPIKEVRVRSPTIQKKSPDIKTKAYSASVHTSHGVLIPRRTKEKKRSKPSSAPQQPTSSGPKQSGPLKSLDTNLNQADRPLTNPFRKNLEKKAAAVNRPTAVPQPQPMPSTPDKRTGPHKPSNPFASSTILGDTPIFPRAKVTHPPNPATARDDTAIWRYDSTIGTHPKPPARKCTSQPESHFRRPVVAQPPQNLTVPFFGRFGQKSRSASQERARDSMSGFSVPLLSRANTDVTRSSNERSLPRMQSFRNIFKV